MKRSTTLALGVPVFVLAAYGFVPAASGHPQLTAKACAKGDSITIDERYHETAEINPGQGLEWVLECWCPDEDKSCDFPLGTELKIKDIRHLAILDLLDAPEKARVKSNAHDGKPVKPDYKTKKNKVYKVGDAFPGGGFEPTTAKNVVRSTPYRKFEHGHLWKFTWVVEVKGVEKAKWDPHFSGRR